MGKVRKNSINKKCQLKHSACQLMQFCLRTGGVFMQTFLVGGLRVHRLPEYVNTKGLWIEGTVI